MWYRTVSWYRCLTCEEWIAFHDSIRALVCKKCSPKPPPIPFPIPFIPHIEPLPWVPRPQDIPGITFTPDKWTNTNRQKCAFDGLPPGGYLIHCTCPSCSPRMVSSG